MRTPVLYRCVGCSVRVLRLLGAVVAALVFSVTTVGGAAAATLTPLSLSYSITAQTGGTYLYDFDLVLDNNDGSWVAGQQWDWIVFGDRQGSGSAASGFCPTGCGSGVVGNIAIITPGWQPNTSGGGMQGPMIQYGGSPGLPGWQPSAVGERVEWTYTSNILLQNNLYWSTVVRTPNTNGASYNLATLTSATLIPPGNAVPEPTTWALMIGGFGAAGVALRRRQRRYRWWSGSATAPRAPRSSRPQTTS
jgi:hypothetical protein